MDVHELKTCPKCKKTSGDDWEQCEGLCPVSFSPHYDPLTEHVFEPNPFVMEVDQSFLDQVDTADETVRKRYEAQAELERQAMYYNQLDDQ